jgi:hypothetical protein
MGTCRRAGTRKASKPPSPPPRFREKIKTKKVYIPNFKINNKHYSSVLNTLGI